jgi:hypothetical protein
METTSFQCPECFLNLHVTESGPFCVGCGWNIEQGLRTEFPYLSNVLECPTCHGTRVAMGAPKNVIAMSTARSRSKSENVRIHPMSLSYITSRHLGKAYTAQHNECLSCHGVWDSSNILSESVELLEAAL